MNKDKFLKIRNPIVRFAHFAASCGVFANFFNGISLNYLLSRSTQRGVNKLRSINSKSNKRGISSVVTLAFIILGTVIGVVLLWVFVNKNIGRGGDVIDPDCLTLNLELTECKAYGLCNYGSGLGSYAADVLVKRGIGQGNVTGLRFVFESSAGIKQGIYDGNLNSRSLNELENLKFLDPYSIPVPGGEPYLVQVVALIGKKKDVCPIASLPKQCNIMSSPPPTGAIPNTTWVSGNYHTNPRGGFCCQFLANQSECYNGLDGRYRVDPSTGLVSAISGAPALVNGLPPGNRTICCQRDPGNGNTITYSSSTE